MNFEAIDKDFIHYVFCHKRRYVIRKIETYIKLENFKTREEFTQCSKEHFQLISNALIDDYFEFHSRDTSFSMNRCLFHTLVAMDDKNLKSLCQKLDLTFSDIDEVENDIKQKIQLQPTQEQTRKMYKLCCYLMYEKELSKKHSEGKIVYKIIDSLEVCNKDKKTISNVFVNPICDDLFEEIGYYFTHKYIFGFGNSCLWRRPGGHFLFD